MASRTIFDPFTCLKIAPLVSSTATLWFAQDQHFFLSLFTNPEIREEADDILPRWFEPFFYNGLPRVLVPITVTASACLANLRMSGDSLRSKGAFAWYAAGAVCAIGHLTYVPWVAPPIENIVKQKTVGRNVEELSIWLKVNALRMMTTDLGAWVCCLIAVVRTFS
ncbi:hypothetical protein MKZ38_005744 [Zalerion maritima]|uniref:Uncharacterized protein n=1 Tax=Zalerion maritima TaxID=339359 RepID=A0AAD5RKN4_9PEZI|nr:hypothetical protein MKZ38_005744 [Zalerion maritima]